MDGVHESGSAELEQLAAAFRSGDKVLRRRISKALRDSVRPVGDDVIRKGAARLPHRGGLAERVASRGRVSASLTGGSSMRATLTLANRDGIKLAGLDAGLVRHPVHGHRGVWVSQQIPDRVFSGAFESTSELARVRDHALAAMNAAARELAADAT